MSRGWRAFSYVMGANFQAVFLLFAASDLKERCGVNQSWVCDYKQYFFPAALLISGYIYFQVISALVRLEKQKKE